MTGQHEGARWRMDAFSDDAPSQQPMGKGIKPAQRKAPTTDQKKVRREMQRQQDQRNPRTAAHHTADADGDEGSGSGGYADYLEYLDTCQRKGWQPMDRVTWQVRHQNGVGQDWRSASLQAEADYQYVKKQGDKWVVLQKGTGKVLSHHDSEEEAKASFRAMMSNKHGSYADQVALSLEEAHKAHHHDNQAVPACPLCPGNTDVGYPRPQSFAQASRVLADIDRAGDRECEACGQVGPPVLGDTGPICSMCGSYSLKRAPYRDYPSASETSRYRTGEDYERTASQHTATQFQTNIAAVDGRLLVNQGDHIRMPNGQTVEVKNIRRHETARDHFYVDTDAGTTLLKGSTSVEVVPRDTRNQAFPGYGVPGGNFNYMPGHPQANESHNDEPHGAVCPSCGRAGSMHMRGGKYQCSQCGYSTTRQGDFSFSDSPYQYLASSRWSPDAPHTAVARRAAEVSATHEGDTL